VAGRARDTMDKIRIRGGLRLDGAIDIGGAKNAALPLMVAALLSDKPLTLTNVPATLMDIRTLSDLLSQHGTEITLGDDGHTMVLHTRDLTSTTAPYDLVRKMRASILVLGPLVARAGQAKVSLPGGCAIGNRPVDLHLMGLEALGAEIELLDGYVHARAPQGLVGAEIVFPKVSVGATEHLMMAAALAKGETVLMNAAREPEVSDLARCLEAMGVRIDGIGSDRLTIHGRQSLQEATHDVVADRIEAGTYAMAAAVTGGKLLLRRVRANLLEAAIKPLRQAGVRIEQVDEGLLVEAPTGRVRGVDVMTEPYPGFPTDLQAQFMGLMTVCEGASMITESIFENRFMHVPELARMGANITVHGSSALVRGVEGLTGAPVMATDLRASVSLVLAGLAARGDTVISRVYHLDRGYERLEEKLRACGGDVERVRSDDMD
jgi:UDP-N-acetylglucosamine 1-carboxyvinyltransferase